MSIKFTSLLLLSVLSTFSFFSQELVQNKKESAITFEIKNFGFTVNGSFKNFFILSNFNSSNLKGSFLNSEISVKSIFTDSEIRDEHLLESDYFDVEKHPKIIFKSSKIEKKEANSYLLKGALTIKGKTKVFEVPLKIIETKKDLKLIAFFTLNRKDFDVGGSSFVLSKKVAIKMIYVANKN